MKRTKRILSLVLAMVMAFALLAMPAMAASEDEGIEPQGITKLCTCGGLITPHRKLVERFEFLPGGCKDFPGDMHEHRFVCMDEFLACDSCTYQSEVYEYTVVNEFCVLKEING